MELSSQLRLERPVDPCRQVQRDDRCLMIMSVVNRSPPMKRPMRDLTSATAPIRAAANRTAQIMAQRRMMSTARPHGALD